MAILFDRSGAERVPNGTADGMPVYTYQDNCGRCGGAGGSERWRHTGLTCYDCGGSGRGQVRAVKLYTAEKLAALTSAAEKRQAKAAQVATERDARRCTFLVDNAELLTKLRSLKGDFWERLYVDMVDRSEPPSVRQTAIIEAEVARVVARAANRFVGSAGERIVLTVMTESVIDITPMNQPYGFGARSLFIAHDSAGNRIVYRGNGDFPHEGESATLKATVADHTEYNGEKQTVVQRPRIATPCDGTSSAASGREEL